MLVCAFSGAGQEMRKRTVTLMGSRFDITVVEKDSITAENRIDDAVAEIVRIEQLISDWKPDSQVSHVNRNAGIRPVVVDSEVFELTKRAIELSRLTNGAFDISFAALDKIWKFDGSMTDVPSPESIRKSIEKVGYHKIVLDSVASTIFLTLPGMKIGFGSIGKGYAADKARELLESKRVPSGIINASGDMATWGKQPDGTNWNIGITNPFKSGKLVKIVALKRKGVATSGNYEKFIELDGRRYSHIINPVTGYPVDQLASVSVFGPSAEMANGFSTSIMVLGKNAGIKLIERYPEYSYIIITEKGKITKSRKFRSTTRKSND